MALTAVLEYTPSRRVYDGDSYYQYGFVRINILDSEGNPTNGDNCIVYYQQVLDGVVQATQNVTIPGQSVIIYNGPFGFYDREGTLESNGVSYLLTGRLDPGTPAPPIAPDIKIISIQIIRKADSAGNHGEAKVTASSSSLPITYSIDGVLFSSDGDFTNLPAGPHTARVTDPTDTIVEQDFTMPKADSILIGDPSKIVAGKISRWSAAFNPIVFTYQRRDFDVTAIIQDDTTLRPKITVNTTLTGLSIGDYVYLDCGLTNGLSTYKGAYKVLDFGTIFIILDTDYVAPDTVSGFCNIDALRPYYKVITTIKAVDPFTGLFKTIVSINRPINSITKADISSYLQSLLKPQPDLSDYTLVNYRDMGLAVSYQITYAETWEGETPIVNTIDDPFYATFAAKQLQEYGGGNMFNYVTQQGGTQLAKWLSDFDEPAYTAQYPFDLPFIYSEQIAGLQIYSKITLLDINRQPLGTGTVTSFLLNEDGSYLLNQDGSKFIIARQQLVNTPIVEHVGLNRLLIGADYGPEAWYLQVQLFYDVDSVPVPVTEIKIVRIDKTLQAHPVYVRWIGLNGAWNYYRFNYNQIKTLDIQNAVIIKNYVSDWENQEGIEEVISKDASEKIQVFANEISKNDIDGLRSLKMTPIAQYLTSGSPLKWQTIVVNSATFTEYETQNEHYDFGITFNKASYNTQTN